MASAVGAIGTGVMVLLGVWVVLRALRDTDDTHHRRHWPGATH
jgi:hypothetical protein